MPQFDFAYVNGRVTPLSDYTPSDPPNEALARLNDAIQDHFVNETMQATNTERPEPDAPALTMQEVAEARKQGIEVLEAIAAGDTAPEPSHADRVAAATALLHVHGYGG